MRDVAIVAVRGPYHEQGDAIEHADALVATIARVPRLRYFSGGGTPSGSGVRSTFRHIDTSE